MKTTHVLFGLLILMAVSVVILCVTQEEPSGQGFDHPDFPPGTIQQAPGGMERYPPVIIAAGGCFGALTSLFVVACCALGLNQEHVDGMGARVLTMAGLVYTALFAPVVVLYWRSLHIPPADVFGFPASTAWMLLVLGPSPLLLVMLYMATYSRWVLLPQDEEKFHDLVARREKNRAGINTTE